MIPPPTVPGPAGPAATLLFSWAGGAARRADANDIPAIQRFWEASPEYLQLVEGRGPGPAEGAEFVAEPLVPPEMSCSAEFNLVLREPSGAIGGLAAVAQDLHAQGVWHIGLFVAATRLHGSGWAAGAHAALIGWAVAAGAQWMRLNVVESNRRGHAFWRRHAYREVGRRVGIAIGARTHTLITMVRPIAADLRAYRAAVPIERDADPQ